MGMAWPWRIPLALPLLALPLASPSIVANKVEGDEGGAAKENKKERLVADGGPFVPS